MGHTHINTIDTSRSCNHHNRKNENRNNPIFSWILFQPHPKNFPEGNKKWKLTHTARPQQSTLSEASTY